MDVKCKPVVRPRFGSVGRWVRSGAVIGSGASVFLLGWVGLLVGQSLAYDSRIPSDIGWFCIACVVTLVGLGALGGIAAWGTLHLARGRTSPVVGVLAAGLALVLPTLLLMTQSPRANPTWLAAEFAVALFVFVPLVPWLATRGPDARRVDATLLGVGLAWAGLVVGAAAIWG